jgi:CRP/FNR family transcriptional regulator, transcriptional activator FtrB
MPEIEVIGSEDRDLAANTVLLKALSGKHFDQLMQQSCVRSYSKGSPVFRLGAQPEHLHVVLRGCVALTGHSADDKTTVVEFREPGDSFVLAAVALSMPYLLSGRAATQAHILHIPAEPLRTLIRTNHAFALAAVETLSLQWRQFVSQITDLKLKSSAQRLGAYLLMLAQDSEVRLPGERQLVAARLGMTPESLSRAFARLKLLGVLGRGQSIRIEDRTILQSFCDRGEAE